MISNNSQVIHSFCFISHSEYAFLDGLKLLSGCIYSIVTNVRPWWFRWWKSVWKPKTIVSYSHSKWIILNWTNPMQHEPSYVYVPCSIIFILFFLGAGRHVLAQLQLRVQWQQQPTAAPTIISMRVGSEKKQHPMWLTLEKKSCQGMHETWCHEIAQHFSRTCTILRAINSPLNAMHPLVNCLP